MRTLLSAALLIALCLVPLGSPAVTTVQPPDDGITASVQNIIVTVSGTYQNGTVTVTIPSENDGAPETDGQMLLQPGACCDPAMLIAVEADNDPGFILAQMPLLVK